MNELTVATDTNVKCWAPRKAKEFFYFSHENTLKDEALKVLITKSFDQFSNAPTHSSDEANCNSSPKNVQNTSTELDESP